jgi:hypothetical protein
MKRFSFLLAALSVGLLARAQDYKITWGDEIKLKKGTADLDIITADNTGLYFSESRIKMTGYFVIGASYGEAYKLIKVDKNYSEVFSKEYKKELKGLDFNSFQSLGDDIYLFATDYERKNKLFKVYGAKIDKNTGDLVNDFAELGSYELESKRDNYEMKMTAVQNGKYFLMVSNISGKDRVSLGVSLLDNHFAKKENAIINLSFDPGHYSLQDVEYTSNDKIVLLGKEFEETQVGKKKRKRLVFKQYVMSIYNAGGAKEKDIALNSGERFIISGRLIETPAGELLLAGFYSNAAKKEDLNGFFINRVDPQSGQLLLSSFKEINASMLGKSFDENSDDDDETIEGKKQSEKAKADDDEDDFPNSFIIKSVDINPADNSILITSEMSQYSYYSFTTSSYDNTTKTWKYTTTHVHRFTNQDILIVNSDKDGKIRWLNAIPKSQLEEVRTTSESRTGFSFSNTPGDYFATAGGMPYYSSYTSLINNNKLIILLNDHTSNNVNAEYGDKVRRVYNFKKKSTTYGITVDLSTGKMIRKVVYANNDESILMPRHALALNNELFVPSWRKHTLAKTELKFARITIK